MLLTQPYFDKLGRQVVDQLRSDLQSKNLTGFGASVATGQLLDSIRYEATAEALRVYALDYIYYLEKGRKPGKRPPSQVLIPWVIARGMADNEKQAKSIAYLIARKIGEKGTTIFQKGGSDIVSGVVSDDLIRQIVTDIGGMFATQITKMQTLV